ncbi:MAG: Ig-like domain-containing protein, partial [Pseudomonadota bacterium]
MWVPRKVKWRCSSMAVGACLSLAVGDVLANSGGITGRHNNTSNCSSCHFGAFSNNGGLNFSGSDTTPDPGEGSTYSVRLDSNQGGVNGFNAAIYEVGGGSALGTLTESDADVVVSGNEVTHPSARSAGATFTFTWTPSASLDVGDYRLFACVNDADGDGDDDIGDVNGTDDNVRCETLNLLLNSDPVAVADNRTSVSITEDGGAVSITGVLTNDFSGSPAGGGGNRNDAGDSISITADTNGTKGTVTRIGSTLFYDPNNDDSNGADSFTYTITDSEGATDTGTVSVTITPVEDPTDLTQGGSGANITQNIDENDNFSLLFNADDPDVANSTLVWSITNHTNPGLGTPSIVGGSTGASKTIDYNTVTNTFGTDTFRVNVREADSSSSDFIDVTVNVAEVNDPPVITPPGTPGGTINATDMDEDGVPVAFTTINLSATDIDTALADITWGIQTPPASGTATITSTGNNGSVATAEVNYTPVPNFNGLVTFVIQAGEGLEGINNNEDATVSFTVRSVNDPPSGVDDTFQVMDGSMNNVLNVLANDTDVDIATNSDMLEITSVTAASVGTVTLSGAGPNNTLLYTPPASFTTNATFGYTFEDLAGAPASANVTVTPPDDDTDGVPNASDNCPNDANADQADFDGDGMGDECDLDDDNDGISDVLENMHDFLDPFDPSDANEDFDGDGVSNLDELTGMPPTDPSQDDIPPVLTVPTPFDLAATGFFTPLIAADAGVSAVDTFDGPVDVSPDMPGPFRPGQYTINWSASDNAGNSDSAAQTLNVLPTASVTAGSLIGEGGTAMIEVTLNGDAPAYPVDITYTAEEVPPEVTDQGAPTDGVDIDPVSGTLQIASGTSGTIPVVTIADTDIENIELVRITLTGGTNAAISGNNVHVLSIVDDANLAPAVSLLISQCGSAGQAICQGGGNVVVTATTSDPNTGDTLTHDWSGSSNALVDIDASDTTFTFDPSGLADGILEVDVVVSDDGAPSLSTHASLLLNLAATCVTDANGDGIDDANAVTELDAPNLLQAGPGTVETVRIIEVDPGMTVSLGFTAISAQRDGAELTAADLADHGNNGAPSTMAEDSGFDHIGGLFDFQISGFNAANRTARIVLPLSAGLLPNSVYRKFDPATGWRAFVIDANN